DARDVAERLGDIQARARLARRPERVVVPLPPSTAARTAPLADVQRHARRSPTQLTRKVTVVTLDLRHHRTQEPEHLDHRRIDSQHGILLLTPARNAAKAPHPRHREESGSTLQAGAARAAPSSSCSTATGLRRSPLDATMEMPREHSAS